MYKDVFFLVLRISKKVFLFLAINKFRGFRPKIRAGFMGIHSCLLPPAFCLLPSYSRLRYLAPLRNLNPTNTGIAIAAGEKLQGTAAEVTFAEVTFMVP